MRACARLALVAMVVSAGLGLAGCAAIEELKESISRWLDSGPFSDGRGGAFPDDVPDKGPVMAPRTMPKEEVTKAPRKVEPARKPPPREAVALPRKRPAFDAAEPASPQGGEASPQDGEAQPAPPQPAPLRLPTPWPEAPAPGTFSR